MAIVWEQENPFHKSLDYYFTIKHVLTFFTSKTFKFFVLFEMLSRFIANKKKYNFILESNSKNKLLNLMHESHYSVLEKYEN
jgi:hypothetical protein